jgi:hypothetical protein
VKTRKKFNLPNPKLYHGKRRPIFSSSLMEFIGKLLAALAALLILFLWKIIGDFFLKK